MTSVAKMDTVGRRRAGMPLARAERLAAKTETRSSASPRFYAALGFAAIAGLVGYGVVQNGHDAGMPELALAVAKTDAAAPAAAMSPEAPVSLATAASPIEAMPTTEASAAPSEALPMVASAAEPSTAVAASASCLDTIEGLLASLQSAAATDGRWATQQDGLGKLVQATLDCEEADFRVAGSIELAGSGLADLKIRWDRESKVLDLAMIDSFAEPPTQEPASSDDQAIEFVIR
ncbi:hypothetical protein [Tabrizicola sp.]|uniref:hypothetical protein n=1 Tax=Tabrizicola sp. TaxID=2005166 RepID=UPI003F3E005E